MHNKVAHTLARSFVRAGFAALRFNFRGTEGSEGEYDEGVGELDDALAALAWTREHYPHGPLWLAGFSFGAAIAVRAAIATNVSGLISVAPAIYRFADDLAAAEHDGVRLVARRTHAAADARHGAFALDEVRHADNEAFELLARDAALADPA